MNWMLLAAGGFLLVATLLAGVWYGHLIASAGRRSRRWTVWGCIGATILAIGLASFWYAKGRGAAASESPEAEAAAPKPVVPVRTVPIKLADISETITVYGTITSQPGETRVISLPFESRVGQVLVTPGQPVAAGMPLIQVDPSPAARLELQQAKDAATAAERETQQVQEQFEQKLATNSQLRAAQVASQIARTKLESLLKEGAAESKKLTAPAAGIVNKILAQEGQLVPAGGPLLDLVAENRIEVRLGVEPKDAAGLREGADVELFAVHADTEKPVTGHIRLITRQVNPATRLVDVLASLPEGSGLMLEGYVRATIVTASKKGLIVPRGAVVPDETAYAVFTVEGDRAVKRVVHLGLENDKEVEIRTDQLKEGDPVVLGGNYELADGMTVSAEKAP